MNVYESIKNNIKEFDDLKEATKNDLDGEQDNKINEPTDEELDKFEDEHSDEILNAYFKKYNNGVKDENKIDRQLYSNLLVDMYLESKKKSKLKKESGSQTTSLDYVKKLAGYLQDFIDGCEERNMTELSLPYSHLAGDALAVAGDRGGWITLTSDFSDDYDEVFNEYRVDEPIEDSESIKEDDEERVEISLGNEKRYVKPGSTEESMLNAAKNKLQGLEDRISNLSLFDNKVEVSFDNKATGGFSSTKVTFDKDGKITEVSTNASLIDTDFLSLASELVKRMEDQ